jgi:Type I phosphodiesterase / nucleotide pyrophosphatase
VTARCKIRTIAAALSVLSFALAALAAWPAAGANPSARLVILMVWDGLRPDSVTRADTPNLYELEHEGVYFADHHSIFPTLTMVNATALATGAPPGANGIIANSMYIAHLLGPAAGSSGAQLERARTKAVSLENSKLLAALRGPGGLPANLVYVPTVAQQLLSEGGFVGIVGKAGPTFVFDDRVGASARESKGSEIFVSDDQVVPQSLAPQLHGVGALVSFRAALAQLPPFGDQDERLAGAFIDQVLPAAASALKANRSGLLVLWQHNPDITEHAAGLGTAAFFKALATCDANLGKLRAALKSLGLDDRTDLIVVSDHGFATIKMRIDLAGLLVAQGLKKSPTSDDVVVAHNFGVDTIYLSPQLDRASRDRLLRKIVDYAAAQEWCGPIFSGSPDLPPGNGYTGEIPGTFSQRWFGLFNQKRSPDLVISFRELTGEDNSRLMGPDVPARVLGAGGTHTEPNKSEPLVRAITGVSYADTGSPAVTTGNGTHGALGRFEIHNFCSAIGPDFRSATLTGHPPRILMWRAQSPHY